MPATTRRVHGLHRAFVLLNRPSVFCKSVEFSAESKKSIPNIAGWGWTSSKSDRRRIWLFRRGWRGLLRLCCPRDTPKETQGQQAMVIIERYITSPPKFASSDECVTDFSRRSPPNAQDGRLPIPEAAHRPDCARPNWGIQKYDRCGSRPTCQLRRC